MTKNCLLYFKGDGDSSVMKRLKEIMPYGPTFIIQKIECRNHLLRNYGTKLMALIKNTKYPIHLRKHIHNNCKRFRFAITKSIEYRNTLHDQSTYQKVYGNNKIIFKTVLLTSTNNDYYFII